VISVVFGLIDLVGIDLMPKLSESLLSNLPKEDAYRDIFVDHKFVHDMIEAGYTGRKGKGGFYRLNPDAPKGTKEKQALAINEKSFDDTQYMKSEKKKATAMKSVKAGRTGLRAVVETDDAGGKYAWEVLKQTLFYAAELVGEIADTVHDIDEGMKLGYNWKKGPFEMIDALGPKWFADKLLEEDIGVPDILDQLIQDEGTTFYRIENGLCFEKTSKMNTFDEEIFNLLEETNKFITKSDDYNALVIYNEASHFSAGANLGLAIFMINIAMWPQVEGFVSRGQKVFMDLKFANFPMIGAPSGMALGGGCEILLSSDAVQAHAETYTGLVEVGVGLIPGWGGCKEMILRYQEREKEKFAKDMGKIGKDNIWFSPDTTPVGAVRKAFETIGVATVAKSAFEAQDIGYFRYSDGISMNRDRLLFDAKKRAVEMAKDYTPPEKAEDIRLGGAGAKMALDLAVSDLRKSGKATPYDVVVSDHLANVLSGGDKDYTETLSEDDLIKLELSEFMKLLRHDGTLDRIEHMLSKGKPLRN